MTPPAKRPQPPGPAARTCIMVLGMHRSGTSMLTRILSLLGGGLPSDLLGANASNPEGHWESIRAIEINDALLTALGRRWDDIRELPDGWLQRPETEVARQQIRAFVERESAGHALWLLKEPRLCRLAPLWMEVMAELGLQVRVVIPVRHPGEVAYSLTRRDGIAPGRSHLLWLQHLVEAERSSRATPRTLVHFHACIADWRAQARHIASALEIEWPISFEAAGPAIDSILRADLRHSNAQSGQADGSSPLLPAPVAKLYGALLRASDSRAWQAISRVSARLVEAASLYAPGIDDLAQQAERNRIDAVTVHNLLSIGMADRERWQHSVQLVAQIREENREIAGKLDETNPVLKDMLERLDDQREVLGPAVNQQLQQITQWRAETQIIAERAEQSKPLLQELIREIGEQRGQLVPALQYQTEQIGQLSQLLGEREGELIQLRQSVAEHRAQLEQLGSDHRARLEQLKQLGADHREQLKQLGADHRAQLEQLGAERLAKDAQLSGLLHSAATRDGQLASQALALRELEGQIAGLEQALAEREALVADLMQTVAGYRQEIVALESSSADLRMDLMDLTATIDSRNLDIQQLGGTIVEHLGEISTLNEAVAGQAARAARLEQELAGRDEQIAGLKHRIFILDKTVWDAEATVLRMRTSRSWRITEPLRALTGILARREKWIPAVSNRVELRCACGRALTPDNAVALSDNTGVDDAGPAQDFDEAFYLMQYPDIGKSGINPYRHFIEHGRAEGRLGSRPKLVIKEGGVPFDAGKETVLVVSHEASRTGAPILSLNIVQGLQQRYNVACLLLGEGPLVSAFQQEVSLLLGPMALRSEPLGTALVIDQLLDAHPIKFAIVNSIESRVVLESLAKRAVPSVSLVHEFAAYTRPRQAFRDAVYWAGETVFSTPITRDNAISEYPDLADLAFNVIPQGRCRLLAEDIDEIDRLAEDRRVLNTLRPDGSADDKVVVIGAGFVQQRKGVDLFLECAARVLRKPAGRDCRFVWIGKGYNPEHDMGYSVYLADQLRRSGLEGRVAFMDETSSIEVAYAAADMLLVSSRLDPLPNVAIDAMAHGLPVICFDKTTGIADILAAAGLSDHCVAAYIDTVDMADKVLALAESPQLREQIGERVQALVEETFAMDRYIGQLEQLAAVAAARIASESNWVKEIIGSSLMQADYFQATQDDERSIEKLIQFDYLRCWASGVRRRKLFPGFHPGIYLEQHGVAQSWIDPLVDYLRSGRPPGPWNYKLIHSDDSAPPLPGQTRVALHVHVFYADLLPEILRRLALNSVRPDLFISVPNEEVAADVAAILTGYDGTVVELRIVPNRGRDIGPLLTAFGPALVEGYDIVGHLHTKKSADVKDESMGRSWYQFLLENLLGGEAGMADLILGQMAADPTIGMVFPDDPNVVGWGNNRPFAEELAASMGLGPFPEHFLFPVGTMFWARTTAIRPLVDLGLDWGDYPAEPLPYDGSRLHALERLFPFVAQSRGCRPVLTCVRGVTR